MSGAVRADAAPSTAAAAETCDVLVIGSGGGGLATAVTARRLGLDVLVAEKAEWVGGTTAFSGGGLWIPGNPIAVAAGIADSKDAAREYLRGETGRWFDAERVEAFLDAGPRMIEFFLRETEVRFWIPPTFPDYHAENAGGARGRTLLAESYDARRLGAALPMLRRPLPELTLLGMMIGSSKELGHFFRMRRSLKSAAFVGARVIAHARDLLFYRRGVHLTNGNALVGMLLRSALDAGVRFRLRSGVKNLLLADDGGALGALLGTPEGPVHVHARRGVVLACGGFPHDIERRARLFPHAPRGTEHWSPAPATNTGDGIRLAESIGAGVEETLPNAAAWVPVSRVKRDDGTEGVFPHFIDRAKPGVIAVNRAGRRFTNEGDSYHDFCLAMMESCAGGGEVAAWLVCDHRTLRKYGLGFAKPFPLPVEPYVRMGYLLRGNTPAELARAAGIDAPALEATLVQFNAHAARHEDPAFGKGSRAYNRHMGDPDAPHPCLAPLATPPFYAVKVVMGDLGTYAGITTDAQARVLDAARRPVPRLHAVGNDAASIMGGNYPGAGITLGPAMTFGWLAAHHLAQRA
jgi:succinate dehydrogenase/fumarate reductase flavoprotein subunit